MIHADHIQEIARRLAEGFDPARIILFGSHARGDATAHSDVDMIVLLDQFENWLEITAAMHKAMRGIPLGCDFIVFTPDEYAVERQIPGTAARYADQEGKTLYERAA